MRGGTNPWIYYGKKLVIFMISVGLLSFVIILCFQTCTGRSTVFLLRRTSGKDESLKKEQWAEEKLGLNDKHFCTVWQVDSAGQYVEISDVSYKYKMDVLEVLEGRLGNTLLLGGTGLRADICRWHCCWESWCAWNEGGRLD